MQTNSYPPTPTHRNTEGTFGNDSNDLNNIDFILHNPPTVNSQNEPLFPRGTGYPSFDLTTLHQEGRQNTITNSPVYCLSATTTPALGTFGDDFNYKINSSNVVFDESTSTPVDPNVYSPSQYLNLIGLEGEQQLLTDALATFPEKASLSEFPSHSSPAIELITDFASQGSPSFPSSALPAEQDAIHTPILPDEILHKISAADYLAIVRERTGRKAETTISTPAQSLIGLDTYTSPVASPAAPFPILSRVTTPVTAYFSSPVLSNFGTPAISTGFDRHYFPALSETQHSPHLPPQTPGTYTYASDHASTAPSSTVNTPFTASIPNFLEGEVEYAEASSLLLFCDKTPIKLDRLSNAELLGGLQSQSLPRNRHITKTKRPHGAQPLPLDNVPLYADLINITPSPVQSYPQNITVNMASVSPKQTPEADTNGTSTETHSDTVTISKVVPEVNSNSSGSLDPSVTLGMDTLDESSITTIESSGRPVPIRPRPNEDISAVDSSVDAEAEDEDDEPTRKRRKSDSSTDAEETTDGKIYHCSKCPRRFGRKFNMQTHMMTHDPNRVKPFACDLPGCGSRFTRKHDLKRHINGIHKGEKVHECNVCQKPFSRKDAWKRHQATCGKN